MLIDDSIRYGACSTITEDILERALIDVLIILSWSIFSLALNPKGGKGGSWSLDPHLLGDFQHDFVARITWQMFMDLAPHRIRIEEDPV